MMTRSKLLSGGGFIGKYWVEAMGKGNSLAILAGIMGLSKPMLKSSHLLGRI